MSLFDVSKIREQADAIASKQYSYAPQKGTYTFNNVKMGSLNPGNYRIRLIWADVVKNPKGIHLVSTSSIVDATGKKHSWLAAECLPPEEGYDGVDQVLRAIDTNNLYGQLKANPASAKLCDVIDSLIPWRRYWIVAYLYATEVKPTGDEKYSRYQPNFDPHAQPLDVTLEINASVNLFKAILDAVEKCPDLSHYEHGRDLLVKVAGNKYTLEGLSDPYPLSEREKQFVGNNYPNLVALSKKWNYKAPSEIYGLLKAMWWFPYFTKMGCPFPEPMIELPSVGGNAIPAPLASSTKLEGGGIAFPGTAAPSADQGNIQLPASVSHAPPPDPEPAAGSFDNLPWN